MQKARAMGQEAGRGSTKKIKDFEKEKEKGKEKEREREREREKSPPPGGT